MVSLPVKTVMFRLRLGDRFERDLIESIRTIVDEPEIEFDRLRDVLLESELVYRLRGDAGSYYLALTDVGQAVADGLYQIEALLADKRK